MDLFSFGVEESKISSVLSSIGLGNFLGRILDGKLLDIFRTKKFMLVKMILLLHSVCLILSNLVESYIGQVKSHAGFRGDIHQPKICREKILLDRVLI